MRVSIGILAWNEAASIGGTIEALLRQSLFTDPPGGIDSLEVICVPNGCTDQTATVARQALARWPARVGTTSLNWRVCETPQACKSIAWNQYVHEFSDPAADYLFLMDADVRPGEPDTLVRLILALKSAPHACISTPEPVKDIALKPRKTLFDRLSLACSRMHQETPALLAGGLYCARGGRLRDIWLPTHLLVEDGFLRAMIVTDQFRTPEDFTRIVRAPGATLIFEACRTLRQLFRHERRVAMGTAMNTLLFDEVVKHAQHPGIAAWVRQRNLAQPDWPIEVVRRRASQNGRWLIPRPTLLRRLRWLRGASMATQLKRMPLAVGALLFDLPIFLSANRALTRGCIRGAW